MYSINSTSIPSDGRHWSLQNKCCFWMPSNASLPSPGASENPATRTVQPSLWVPDDMASVCYLCGKEFNVVRRRHHCRQWWPGRRKMKYPNPNLWPGVWSLFFVCLFHRKCGRVCCDACSSKRIHDMRTCDSCWDRIGRKLSGLSRNITGKDETATRERDRKSVLFELLEVHLVLPRNAV